MSEAHLDTARNCYVKDGREFARVSTVLKDMRITDDRWFPRDGHAAEIGTAVHAACHLLAEGRLDWESVDPAIRGYVDGFEAFCSETSFVYHFGEQIVVHPLLRYGGRFDLIGDVQGESTLIDLKSGTSVPVGVRLQLSAYVLAWVSMGHLAPQSRASLQLKPTGKYVFQRYDAGLMPKIDQDGWAGLVTVWHWMVREKLIKTGRAP